MTKHMDERMNHRGITRSLANLTLDYGEWIGDRCILSRNAIRARIAELDNERKAMLRALDKGGMVVVEVGGREITTYAMKKPKGRLHHD